MESWLLMALLLANLALLVWLAVRKPAEIAGDGNAELLNGFAEVNDRLERELRREISDNSRSSRQELAATLASFQQALVQQGAEATRTQNTQIDAFCPASSALLQQSLSDTLATQLQSVSESNARRMGEVRETLEKQLAQLQQSNAAKLDEMRRTVDEKLQSTLETRLGESFKQVADRLEQVHKGLGEMQTLAQGVGDLKHLLTNVKTRGIFGEAQLAALLEQVFTVGPVRRTGRHPAAAARTRSISPSSCRAAPTSASRCGCRSMRNFRTKTTSACSMRSSAPTGRAPRSRARRWSCASAWKPSRLPKSTSSRRTPPTSPSCFCRPRACTPRCCAAPA